LIAKLLERLYIRNMKIKTSVTISENLLTLIDEFVDEGQSCSSFFETAAWQYITRLRRAQRNAYDHEIINRQAEFLNNEVMDALEYQVAI